MSISVVSVQFFGERNCFVTLPQTVSKLASKDREVCVYELTCEDNSKVWVSWSGETTRAATGTDGLLQINGLYGNKLGLNDGNQMIIREMPVVASAVQVQVEPLSTDDWEILERNAAYIETHLLDQIRVVWAGQIFPVWVEKSICIFLKISRTDSDEPCVVLENDTEVIVSPKARGHNRMSSSTQSGEGTRVYRKRSLSQSVRSEQSNKSSTGSYKRDSVDGQMSSDENMSPTKSWGWKEIVPWILGRSKINSMLRSLSPRNMENEQQMTKLCSNFPDGLNFMFRVQALKISYESGKKDITRDNMEEKSLFLQQPAMVFVNHQDVRAQSSIDDIDIPHFFYARLTKLTSPKEEVEKFVSNQKKDKKDADVSKKTNTPEKKKTNNHMESPRNESDDALTCIVRVVVINKKKTSWDRGYENMLNTLLKEQPCLPGHVIVSNLLRRLMELDVTRRIWLQSIKVPNTDCSQVQLHPVGSLPNQVSGYMAQKAFQKWMKLATDDCLPLVVFPGVMIRFPLFQGVEAEFQLVYEKDQEKDRGYSLLGPDSVDQVSVALIANPRSPDDKVHWPFRPLLMYNDRYSDVSGFDPAVPVTSLKHLGGVSEYADDAISHIEVCLGNKPLANKMFKLSNPGLKNGMLLITGVKGSGKSSLARAICRRVAEVPNMAYLQHVDCKPLRGKKPDTLLKSLEMVFDEAVWRQPSVIMLDDLDHVIPAPSGPEAEMSAEGIYGARVAEVMRDILRKEINNGSRIAVIATSQSRTTLHPQLTASRGTHFILHMITINIPDKIKRKEILTKILEQRVSKTTLDYIDWDWLLGKTEGFVAKDLDILVSRAIHAYALRKRDTRDEVELILTMEHIKEACLGFTPASIRNVPLHTAGELGWDDVGGLCEVKKILKETLLLPSKYPVLFANSPLRLRSGLMLYGAPGTGKTLLAGVVAKECGLNFISIKGPELLSKYIGASEQAVRDTFLRAQSAKPCILFFDEFDSIAPRRGHDNTGVTDRVVNQLLTQLDGVEGLDGVYVLAATSRPDLIDPALLRPGRLDKCLRCELPNEEERHKILIALTRRIILQNDVDLKYFADCCEYFSGADLKALLYNAQLEAIHEITGRIIKGDRALSPGRSKSDSSLRAKYRQKKTEFQIQKVAVRERRPSWSTLVTYIPKLEDGIAEVTEEMEERLNFQVDQIKARLKVNKSTERVTTAETLFSPVATSKSQMVVISRSHLMAALSKTRPSVSGEERFKYERIYQNFVSSRGGNFGPAIPDLTPRQTLA